MDWTHLPPLSALRAFATVAEEGTLSAAGRRLNVSHAAISQQVRSLEDWFGCRLVRREGRGVCLTDEGRQLAGHLDTAFRGIRKAVDELSQAGQARPLQADDDAILRRALADAAAVGVSPSASGN